MCVLHGYCYLCVFFPLLPYIAVHCRYRCTFFPSWYSLELIACSLETSSFCLQILFPIAVLFLECQNQMSPARVGALARVLHRCSERSSAGWRLDSCAVAWVGVFISVFLTLAYNVDMLRLWSHLTVYSSSPQVASPSWSSWSVHSPRLSPTEAPCRRAS